MEKTDTIEELLSALLQEEGYKISLRINPDGIFECSAKDETRLFSKIFKTEENDLRTALWEMSEEIKNQ